MLGNIDMQKLLKARAYLEDLKNGKLAFRAERYFGDENRKYFTMLSLRKHLIDEFIEFEAGYDHQSSKEMVEELADISSMCDVIAMKLLEHCIPYCEPEDLEQVGVNIRKCRKCGAVVQA